MALLCVCALALIGLGVLGGAAGATSSAASAAAQLAATGAYARAIALDDDIASRTGVLFLLDRSDVGAAPRNAERAMLAWAASLGAKGQVDAAAALYDAVTDPTLRARAGAARATLLLRAGAEDAARGDFASATLRLDEVVSTAAGTPAAAQAAAALPLDQIGEAQQLVAAGRGPDAVTLLDGVVTEGSEPARRQADALYPEALIAAASVEVADRSFIEARTALERLIASYGGSAQGRQARSMLATPQAVSGTLVSAEGRPVSGRVRLSSHYVAEPDGSYLSGPPLYPSSADANGDFVIAGVPVGGPYILEVFSGGTWTTLIDPRTHQPANPVEVTALSPVALTFVLLP